MSYLSLFLCHLSLFFLPLSSSLPSESLPHPLLFSLTALSLSTTDRPRHPMELALSPGKATASPSSPAKKSATENLDLKLWISTKSSLSVTQDHQNHGTSSDPPLQLGLPWSTETSPPGSGGTATPASDEEETELSSARKKLRLSKEQAVCLEESFKERQNLNPKQKAELAKELRLRPRQVEVWFQNRRARTKLKQTEVDCSYLKRSCQALTVENMRLQKEIADLRALNAVQPLYMQLPATTLSLCSNCERDTGTTVSDSGKQLPFLHC